MTPDRRGRHQGRSSAAWPTATRRVHKENQSLEARLADSTAEVERLREHLEQVRRDATTDGLTNLANRKAFDDELDRACAEADDGGSTICLAVLDIDHFKGFNDTWGHQTGDQVIRYVASVIGRVAAPPRFAARYGGEEFAMIFPRESAPAVAMTLEEIRVEVSSRMLKRRSTNEDLGAITISSGFAERKPGERPFVMERADAALYASKRGGRNRVTSAESMPARPTPPDHKLLQQKTYLAPPFSRSAAFLLAKIPLAFPRGQRRLDSIPRAQPREAPPWTIRRFRVSTQDGVATVTLADPATLNAASLEVARELHHAFSSIAARQGRGPRGGPDRRRSRLLLGRQPVGRRCGGSRTDVDGKPDAGSALEATYNPLMTLLRDFPLPIVTAVNGRGSRDRLLDRADGRHHRRRRKRLFPAGLPPYRPGARRRLDLPAAAPGR